MKNAKVMRNLFLLGVLVLCGLLSTLSHAAGKAAQTSPPAAIKKPIQAPAPQHPFPFVVRGTVTAIYPLQSTGPGVKDIEVALLLLSESGQVMPVDTKTTDSEGRYSFILSTADKGKRYKIVPRFLQTCCQGCCALAPAEKEFTFQDRMTADFKLYLPPPDLTISLGTMNAGDYYKGTSFEFEIKNKGYLPSTKSKVNLSFNQPCCPENCAKEAEVPAIPAQGSTKILIVTSINTGARGCGFTATVATQPNEVKTDDNKVTGTSPNLHLSSIQITRDSNFIYVRNKGTASKEVELTWTCYCLEHGCGAGGGIDRCFCPALQPTSASSPVFNESPDCRSTHIWQRANLSVNGEWVYRIPQRTYPGIGCGCIRGKLKAADNTLSHDYRVGPFAVEVVFPQNMQ